MASAPKAALLKQLRHAGTFRAALRAQSNLAALDLGGAAASGGVRAHRPATQPSPGALMSHQACIDGLPADCGYMVDVYDWAYVSPKLVELLDRNIVVTTLLFGNDQRLMRAYLDEVRPGDRVWQVAHVYGDLVRRVADKVGPTGAFHLTDVTPVQIEHAQRKLGGLPWARVMHADAASYDGGSTVASAATGAGSGKPYDVVCSFFLLHEVPDDKKAAIVDNVLSKLPPGGGAKAVFVDYHGPAAWQPVRYILKAVNTWLEPFAFALWDREIASFASRPGDFAWTKRTIFGGVYQIVTAVRKDGAAGAAPALQ